VLIASLLLALVPSYPCELVGGQPTHVGYASPAIWLPPVFKCPSEKPMYLSECAAECFCLWWDETSEARESWIDATMGFADAYNATIDKAWAVAQAAEKAAQVAYDNCSGNGCRDVLCEEIGRIQTEEWGVISRAQTTFERGMNRADVVYERACEQADANYLNCRISCCESLK